MGDNENRRVYEARVVKNFKELLDYSCKNYASNIAYKYKRDYTSKNIEYIEKTYEQVGKDVKSLATEFLDMGLEGKRIVLIGNNRYEWCLSYFAITTGNMIVVPIDKALPDNEIENLVKRSEAEVMIFDKKYLEVAKKLQEKEDTNIKTLICMDKINDKEEINFEELLKK